MDRRCSCGCWTAVRGCGFIPIELNYLRSLRRVRLKSTVKRALASCTSTPSRSCGWDIQNSGSDSCSGVGQATSLQELKRRYLDKLVQAYFSGYGRLRLRRSWRALPVM